MPTFELSPGVSMFYRDDDFTDPWKETEAVLLLHGLAESGTAWNGWMPHFGRRFRVLRPDMRGFGRSTPMPEEYPWSLDGIVADFIRLADAAGIERFHVVGAKIAAAIALRLAASHPERVLTLTLVGGVVRGSDLLGGGRAAQMVAGFKREGLERWARSSMPARLGSDASPAMLDGWSALMGETPVSSAAGFASTVPTFDAVPDLGRIDCPTLVVATDGSGLGSIAEVRAWQEAIRGSELLVLPGNSIHVAASDPDLCAREVLGFIDRSRVKA